MTKQEFLANREVADFISHMAAMWHEGFLFSLNRGHGKKERIARITGLHEALQLYRWGAAPNNQLHHSTAILHHAQGLLREGMENADDAMVREGSTIVLKWGGVFKKGNKERVENARYDLLGQYLKVQTTWRKLAAEEGRISTTSPGFVSNSGFTKVYSLLLDDFIIYDSRVGVALAYMLGQRYRGRQIPEVFKLYVPPSAVSDPSKRAVSIFFEATRQDDGKHFYSNVKSSWLLTAVTERIQADHPNVTLREIEAALFMVGYDIRNPEVAAEHS